jgi:hypothetical protein
MLCDQLHPSPLSPQSNLDRTTNNLSGSLVKAEALDKDLKGASEKYIYVQKVRQHTAQWHCMSMLLSWMGMMHTSPSLHGTW